MGCNGVLRLALTRCAATRAPGVAATCTRWPITRRSFQAGVILPPDLLVLVGVDAPRSYPASPRLVPIGRSDPSQASHECSSVHCITTMALVKYHKASIHLPIEPSQLTSQ